MIIKKLGRGGVHVEVVLGKDCVLVFIYSRVV